MSDNQHDLTMPSFGSDMRKGTLVQWRVKEGDSINRGDVIAVIETYKGAIELDVFEDTRVLSLLVKEGDEIAVGEPIARLGSLDHSDKKDAPEINIADQEEADNPPATADINETESRETAQPSTVNIPEQARADQTGPPAEDISAAEPIPALAPALQGSSKLAVPKGFVLATPAARFFAREQQLSLTALFPHHTKKIITLAMVEEAIKAAPPTQQADKANQTPGSAEIPTAATKGFDKNAMRQAISATVSRSKQQIPHYYLRQRLDISALEEYLLKVNASLAVEQRLLLAAPLLSAIARTLINNPQLNGEYSEDHFVSCETVNLANAVNLRGGGLIMPVIRDAQRLSPAAIMEHLKQQVTRARNNSLLFSELSGGSFTVTSIGERGAEQMFAVIFPPQVAIIALGSAHQEALVVNGEIQIRSVIEASLAADHRVSDGRTGARFLYQLNQLLQKPAALWKTATPSGQPEHNETD
ncbi:dihydrolipoamide acetyltransferase family protein [Psychromonas sp.]|uniref:dihydrolipoamide acetyltransferase family protein n=1 Tax=Psychromonas sp. TaxID=1884585 RepID=UPI00356974F2